MANSKQLNKAELKDAVRRIVLSQGNMFIKELLRDNGIKIGLTKADFRDNLEKAIDDGEFTQDMLEAWLLKVEGWGDQHIYLFERPALSQSDVRPALEKSSFKHLLDKAVSYDFPETLTLTSLSATAAGLSVIWYRSTSGWRRDESKDKSETIDGDLYEFRAYRERYDRAVVRFEWRFADPYCSVLLQLPHENDTHQIALGVVWEDIKALGVAPAPLSRVALSKSFAKLSRDPTIVTQNSKRAVPGGFVIVGSTTPSSGIDKVEAVREVFKSVDDTKFNEADGIFAVSKGKHAPLAKPIKIQGYGEDSRLRVWAQCKRDEVFDLLGLVHDHSK